MALFRRRTQPQEAGEPQDEAAQAAEVDEAPPADDSPSGFDRSHGPYDESEQSRADSTLTRLDLGSLLVPGLPGIGVQVEADRSTQKVMAVTAVTEGAAVQLQAFAAPRSEGVWDEIREEMRADIQATAGARVTEEIGPFGPELRAVLPARTAEGAQSQQRVRFVGIDGPRWFLRAVFLGRAAVQPDPGDDLHRVVRETIVVRGPDAMAPRDPLPLRLPVQPEAPDAHADEGSDEEGQEPGRFEDLDPFERGPEITETR